MFVQFNSTKWVHLAVNIFDQTNVSAYVDGKAVSFANISNDTVVASGDRRYAIDEIKLYSGILSQKEFTKEPRSPRSSISPRSTTVQRMYLVMVCLLLHACMLAILSYRELLCLCLICSVHVEQSSQRSR